MAGGRPSDYEPRFAEIVRDLMLEGASIEEIAWYMRRSKQVIYEWKEKFPEFADALKSGKDFGEGWWKWQGRENIKNKDFNSTLWYMNMKNRYGWADKQEQTNTNTHTVTIDEITTRARENLDEYDKPA